MHHDHSPRSGHHHAGKSSERFLDKELILKELAISPGQVILDAGCGNGYMSKEFSHRLNHTGKVYALDPDHKSIDTLSAETQGTNIAPFLGDITKTTPLAAASLDLIYVATVLHGFDQDQMSGFAAEIKRLLKPKGILAIIEIKKEPTPFGPPLEMRFSPQELAQLIPLIPRKTVDVGEYFYMQIFENNS